jgi:hypothetical protein
MRLWIRCMVLLSLFAALPALAGGLKFEEEMRGYGLWQGEFRDLHLDLAVRIADVNRWRSDSSRLAQMQGAIRIDQQAAIAVTGDLQVLSTAPGVEGRLLVYRLSGNGLRFFAVKHVRDDGGADLMDDVTLLRGQLLPPGAAWPTISSILAGQWSTEVQFEWWRPSIVIAFIDSFETIDTPWYDRLRIKWVFIETTFGDVASEFFWNLIW